MWKYNPLAVMHFAAYAYVGGSVEDPAKYYRNNVAGTLTLLETMRDCGIDKIIFSSTCATYGMPEQIPIAEDHPQNPINPYGRSKLMIEWILKDFANAYDMKYVSLRYFNAAGADPDAEIGEDHDPEPHLVPIILDVAVGKRDHLKIFGTDDATPDGRNVSGIIFMFLIWPMPLYLRLNISRIAERVISLTLETEMVFPPWRSLKPQERLPVKIFTRSSRAGVLAILQFSSEVPTKSKKF